jgi:Uma2 family endonuclease
MHDQLLYTPDSRIILRMQSVIQLTEEQFFYLCQINRELRIERTKEGDLILMSPPDEATGWRSVEIGFALGNWATQTPEGQAGVVFDPATGFILPNGAMRVPSAAWVKRSRFETISSKQKEQFLPVCPDFVIELRSSSDTLDDLQAKMVEYLENGIQLGWLIDPKHKLVYIYRPGKQVECLDTPETVSGDPELPGFILNVQDIWTPDF